MVFSVKKTIILVSSFVVGTAMLLSSCDVIEDSSTSVYVPEPANQFAIDKETETSTIEETKAHHQYKDIDLQPGAPIVIGTQEFLTKINYITNHIEEFKETVIEIEGMFAWYKSWDETFKFPMVYRNGPGCCGDDQYGGFFLVNVDQEAYEIDDWIKVSGCPFMYEHTDSEGEVQKFPFIIVESIEVLPVEKRKAEMVND